MRVSYYLKRVTVAPDVPTALMLFVRFHCHTLKFPVGISIARKYWNADKQRTKRGYLHEVPVNSKLDNIAASVTALFMKLQTEHGRVEPNTFRESCRQVLALDAMKVPKDFLGVFDGFIDSAKERLRPASIKTYKTVRSHLEGFAKAYDLSLTFARVDRLFLERFVGYLLRVAGLNNRSAQKAVTILGTFLRWANEQGHSDSTEYKLFTRKAVPEGGERSNQVYLTARELQTLMGLDLSGNTRLEKVRDLFILQAHTGLRYGDVQQLGPEHIQETSIHLVTGKNRKAVTIPFLPAARAVWEKYGGKLPKISNQKQNDYLKELGQLAGLDQPVVVVDYRGIERIETIQPKYELIGTHTAKRSFVTVLRLRGVSIESIMKVTGNSRKTIETYIVATEEDVAREIETAWA